MQVYAIALDIIAEFLGFVVVFVAVFCFLVVGEIKSYVG